MRPEDQARRDIDGMLEESGWIVQDYGQRDLGASLGVAIREFPLGRDARRLCRCSLADSQWG